MDTKTAPELTSVWFVARIPLTPADIEAGDGQLARAVQNVIGRCGALVSVASTDLDDLAELVRA